MRRFVRNSRSQIPADGGWFYSAGTLISNTFEERNEDGFSSGKRYVWGTVAHWVGFLGLSVTLPYGGWFLGFRVAHIGWVMERHSVAFIFVKRAQCGSWQMASWAQLAHSSLFMGAQRTS